MLTWLAETPLEVQTKQAVEPTAGYVSSKIAYRRDDENCESLSHFAPRYAI